VLLVTGGRLGDRFGRRRTFLIGIGVASALAVPLLPRKPQADTGH